MSTLARDILAEYPSILDTHARICEHFGIAQDPAALKRTLETSVLPSWAAGGVSRPDAGFLFDLVRCAQPSRILELGVAAGGSSLVMLRTLETLGRPITTPEGDPVLTACDLHPYCYCARDREIGSGMLEAAGELHAGARFLPRVTSLELDTVVEPGSIDLAFIDADHRHPWPTIDLVLTLPMLARGAWVVLHDIELPEIAKRHEARTGETVNWHEHGAQMLFRALEGETLRSADSPSNIGAVRLDDPRGFLDSSRATLASLLDEPFEVDPGERALALVSRTLARGTA